MKPHSFSLISTAMLAGAVAAQAPNAQFVERHPLPSNPTRELCAADFDADGDVDVLLAEVGGVVQLTNDGTARFRAALLASGSYNFIAAGDLDGDGDVDAFVGGGGQPMLLLRNDGTGLLVAEPTAATGGLVSDGTLADVDGDGDLDVIWSELLGAPRFAANDGRGTFSATSRPVLPGHPGGLYADFTVGDFNNDGYDDIACAGSTSFLALGSPTGPVAGDASLFGPRGASAAADFDGDGNLDIVVAGANQLLLGNGDGTFRPSSVVMPASAFGRIAIADFDEDGDLDIAGIDTTPNTPEPLHLLLREGGQFVDAPTRVDIAADQAARLAVADFDGDRDVDVYVGASLLGLAAAQDFVAINRHVQVEVTGPASTGGVLSLRGASQPGYGVGIDLCLLVVGSEPSTPVPTPFGNVHVDATGAVSLPFLALSSPLGVGELNDPIPANAGLVGLEFVVQALVVDLTGTDVPRLSNFERVVVQ